MRSSWGTALWSSFGKQEQLGGAACAAASNRSFEKPQLWGAVLGTSFRTQLWGAAFGSNFAEQLSGAALENSFGEPLWEQTGLKAALGQPLCGGPQSEAAAGNRFGEQL